MLDFIDGPRRLTLAFVIALASLMPIPSSAAPRYDWIELRVGRIGYVASTNGGESFIYVCRDIRVLFDVNRDIETQCTRRSVGSVVRVIDVVRGNKSALGSEMPALKIQSVNARWTGWVTLVDVQPMILPGTHVVDASMGNYEPEIYLKRTDPISKAVSLGAKTVTLEVLKQVPTDGDADFYVRVLSGPKKGLTGWSVAGGGMHLGGDRLLRFDVQRINKTRALLAVAMLCASATTATAEDLRPQ